LVALTTDGNFLMGVLKEIKGKSRDNPGSSKRADQASESNPLFVYVKIPGDLDPEKRWKYFERPLQKALEKDNLGAVTGGGTQFSEPNEDGEDSVEFCGIDINLYDAWKGLVLLRRELVRLRVREGTMLLYVRDGREHEEPVYHLQS
jgi:hypothetical protein